MKILKVIFSNLNSLRGDFVIDFTDEAFTQNGIFAITGPTGAGKSTILDAMCLALYSKTPRLNDVGGSNEIMSRSQGQCKAQVFFEAQGNYYLASFEQHRSRNKSDGALQAKTHKLLKATSKLEVGAEIESGKNVPNKVAEISGLDFDKFRPTEQSVRCRRRCLSNRQTLLQKLRRFQNRRKMQDLRDSTKESRCCPRS